MYSPCIIHVHLAVNINSVLVKSLLAFLPDLGSFLHLYDSFPCIYARVLKISKT